MLKYYDNSLNSLDPISENKKTSMCCTYILYVLCYFLVKPLYFNYRSWKDVWIYTS